MKSLRPAIAAAAAALTALALAPSASGASTAADTPQGGHTPWVSTIDDGVLAPFQLAVDGGDVYASDGFLGTLTRYRAGRKTVLASVEGGGLSGVDVVKGGRSWAYTSSTPDGRTLLTITARGQRDVVADLGAYEARRNPDQDVTYGVVAGSNPCANAAFEQVTGGPARYTGIVESNPYAVAALPDGAWAVADAAGNSILRVDGKGRISTIAVAPRRPLKITRALAASVGLPSCTVGVTYAFEGVPTDVEVGRAGALYFTSLPGGPEDPSLGARGAVFQINPYGGVKWVAAGFLGATNLAVDGGTMYVTELFAGKVTAIRGPRRWTAYRVDRPLSVETDGRRLYIGQLADLDPETGAPRAPGTIIRVGLHGR